ncbi:rasGEF domain-containing serine/threonine-protein kinase X-like [Camellia sinensis]|uniref:rasGEF domain-containing serine/threonine-protein kinase X-like n=1 Tax=Camellia sinensis TaxID=4442 RepID=UPI001035F90E|nr:rasGEF domain-containing serine/threonine-protein kinase X-like [Camellia sinensis]
MKLSDVSVFINSINNKNSPLYFVNNNNNNEKIKYSTKCSNNTKKKSHYLTTRRSKNNKNKNKNKNKDKNKELNVMVNNGNGSVSSVSGTESMERIMERTVTNFLQALQTNIINGMPERREEPVTIKQFQDLKPTTTFTGDPDPMVAEAWVKDMENIFHALPCIERQKVTFAIFTFKDNA